MSKFRPDIRSFGWLPNGKQNLKAARGGLLLKLDERSAPLVLDDLECLGVGKSVREAMMHGQHLVLNACLSGASSISIFRPISEHS